MPLCTRCGRTAGKVGDLVLARNPEERWGLLCNRCRREAAVETTPTTETPADIPTVAQSVLDEGALKTLQEVLEAVRRQRAAEAAAKQPKRRYARHDVSLQMRFAFLRGSEEYEAEVLDISYGGVRFQTRREIEAGQVIRILELESGLFEIGRESGGSLAEARRVMRTEGGLYEVGGRFIRRISVDDRERRRHLRRRADINAYYRRIESEVICRGTVRDISQGGICLVTDPPLQVGETVEFLMQTEPPAFVAAQMRGACRVARVRPRSDGLSEAGCVFTDLSVSPVDSPDESAQAGLRPVREETE